MTRSLALLRAVNVGGALLPMAELRAHLSETGFEDVATFIASGNVLVTSPLTGSALEMRLEAEVAARFGLSTDVMVRDLEEWTRLIDENPLPEAAAARPAGFVCMVLKAPPAPGGWERLQQEAQGSEVMRLVGRRLYVFYEEGLGRSKLTTAFIERRLSTRGTARNWNTVLKLHGLLAS